MLSQEVSLSTRGRGSSQRRTSSASSSRRSSASSSRSAGRSAQRRREAEPETTRYRKKKSNPAPIIISSLVLLVIAIAIFVSMQKKQRAERLEARLAEIEAQPIAEDTPVADGSTLGAADQVLALEDARKEAVARAEAEEAEKNRTRREKNKYEVRNLGHLESTSEADREKIDELVDQLVQSDDLRASDDARDEIIKIRKPAIPRILNRFVDLEMDNEDHILIANVLHRTLFEMVRPPEDQAITFVPQEETTARYVKQRRNSIARWFQWWGDNEATFDVKPDTEESDSDE